jgi:hypothetical protein
MSYALSNNINRVNNVEMDVLACLTSSTYVAGGALVINGPTTVTGVSISSDKLVLSSGASYVIEYATQGYNPSVNWVGTLQWFNETLDTYVGSVVVLPVAFSGGMLLYTSRITRLVARALILASDFGANSTMTFYPRVLTVTSAGSTTFPTGGAPPSVQVIRIT